MAKGEISKLSEKKTEFPVFSVHTPGSSPAYFDYVVHFGDLYISEWWTDLIEKNVNCQ